MHHKEWKFINNDQFILLNKEINLNNNNIIKMVPFLQFSEVFINNMNKRINACEKKNQ